MNKYQKEKPTKSDKKRKPEAHKPLGTSIEKEVLGGPTQDMSGKPRQKRKLKAQ